jgi:hypothetical protein
MNVYHEGAQYSTTKNRKRQQKYKNPGNPRHPVTTKPHFQSMIRILKLRTPNLWIQQHRCEPMLQKPSATLDVAYTEREAGRGDTFSLTLLEKGWNVASLVGMGKKGCVLTLRELTVLCSIYLV